PDWHAEARPQIAGGHSEAGAGFDHPRESKLFEQLADDGLSSVLAIHAQPGAWIELRVEQEHIDDGIGMRERLFQFGHALRKPWRMPSLQARTNAIEHPLSSPALHWRALCPPG